MKHIYLILIAFFTLSSCSSDDNQTENDIEDELSEKGKFTFKFDSTREFDKISVSLINYQGMSNEEIVDSYTLENTTSIEYDFYEDSAQIIKVEFYDDGIGNLIGRYKIFTNCEGDLSFLLLDESFIGGHDYTSIVESISPLPILECAE